MKVIFTDEAKAEVRRRRTWWKKHRDKKALFTQELRRAQRELSSAPKSRGAQALSLPQQTRASPLPSG